MGDIEQSQNMLGKSRTLAGENNKQIRVYSVFSLRNSSADTHKNNPNLTGNKKPQKATIDAKNKL